LSIRMSNVEERIEKREKEVAERESNIAERETKLNAREQDVYNREALDLLSGFRDRLCGLWEMDYRRTIFNETGEVIDEKSQTFARIIVDDETKKLKLAINVREDGYFEQDQIMVEAITVWPVKHPEHLDYFHDLRLNMENGDVIRGPLFVHLDVTFVEGEPARLSGTWYDLDGVFAKARRELWVAQHEPVKPKTRFPLLPMVA